MTSNQSGISPTEFKILVRPDKVEEKTKGGLLLPQEAREREQAASTAGEIVAISPLAFTYADWPVTSGPPKVGDRIIFGRYSGMTVKGNDGEEYRLIADKEIAGVYVNA